MSRTPTFTAFRKPTEISFFLNLAADATWPCCQIRQILNRLWKIERWSDLEQTLMYYVSSSSTGQRYRDQLLELGKTWEVVQDEQSWQLTLQPGITLTVLKTGRHNPEGHIKLRTADPDQGSKLHSILTNWKNSQLAFSFAVTEFEQTLYLRGTTTRDTALLIPPLTSRRLGKRVTTDHSSGDPAFKIAPLNGEELVVYSTRAARELNVRNGWLKQIRHPREDVFASVGDLSLCLHYRKAVPGIRQSDAMIAFPDRQLPITAPPPRPCDFEDPDEEEKLPPGYSDDDDFDPADRY